MTFKEVVIEGLRSIGATETEVQREMDRHALYIAQNDKPVTEAKSLLADLQAFFVICMKMEPKDREQLRVGFEAKDRERDALN